jgi:hypothetical protein
MSAVLVFMICSIADPSLCEEHAIDAPGVATCVYGAQMELAHAVRDGWRVQRWQCRPGEPPETEFAGPVGGD